MGVPNIWLAAAADASDDGYLPRSRRSPQGDRPSSSAPPEDIAILGRLRLDDEAALRELMDRTGRDVLRIAYHYVKREDVAYDIAQDVFLAFWRRRHVLNDSAPLLHYLRRSARYRALDYLKQSASHERTIERAEAQDALAAAPIENSGLMAARAEEVNQAVRQIVERLTPRVREVLLLYYERQLEPGEIAALLGIAPRTVYSQLRTALRALAVALAAHEDDG